MTIALSNPPSSAAAGSGAQRALSASGLALAIAVVALLAFMPNLHERYLTSVAHVVGVALVLATALLLHFVFLGIAVRRLGRSLAGWLALAVLLVPVGGAAALILLAWLEDERA